MKLMKKKNYQNQNNYHTPIIIYFNNCSLNMHYLEDYKLDIMKQKLEIEHNTGKGIIEFMLAIKKKS